jgi:hypothetical protein
MFQPASQTPEKPCSKKSKSTRRKRRARGHDFLVRSTRYPSLDQAAGTSAPLETKTHTLSPTPTTPSETTPLTLRERLLHQLFSKDKSPTPPRWDEADELVKATYFHREIARLSGVSFTLNFGPETEKAARADPKGFTVHVRRRLARALKAVFGFPVPFWFGVDISLHGRPHLHGGIAVALDDGQRLTDALTRAGGKWGAMRGQEHQVDIGARLDDAWADYATRGVRPKNKELFGSMITVTDGIRRAAHQAFKRDRVTILQQLKRSKSIN